MKNIITLQAGENDSGRRLDRILRKALPDHSLSLIHRLLRQKKVLVDGKSAGPDMRIQAGAVITIRSEERRSSPENSSLGKECRGSLPEIVWRGSGIIVFNKPPGLASHGQSDHRSSDDHRSDDSLDALVRDFLAEKLPPSLSFKPGPLHRLDKGAGGLIAFSETLEGARLFSRLLRERKLVKIYLALVEGRIKKDLHWQDDLVRDSKAKKTFTGNTAGQTPPGKTKNAVTLVKALACNDMYTLAEVRIVTGRTHQIRAQAAVRGHPLAGDVKYGGHRLQNISGTGEYGGFFLHAWKIEFEEDDGLFPRRITAPVPEAFQSVIKTLFTNPYPHICR